MAKKSLFRAIPLLLLLTLLLTGCSCKHEWKAATCTAPKTCSLCKVKEGDVLAHTWVDATCTAPKTCSECKATEGKALGHTWADATCTAPKTCAVCKLTEGEALGHTWADATCTAPKTCSVCKATEGEALGHTWADATCLAPKTCSVCKATEGEALGHTWVDATCLAPKTCSVCKATEGSLAPHQWLDATTEAPKTCSVCKATDGERIITDSRFKTANCKDLFGTWSAVVEIPGKDLVDPSFTGVLKMQYTIVFNQDGTYQETTKLLEQEQFNKSVEDFFVDALYKEFANMGYSKEQADAAMIQAYGMNVIEYSKKMASAYNWDNMVNSTLNGVYYVADKKLYSSNSWSATMKTDTYTITNNTLTIDSLVKEYPGAIFAKA